MSHRPRNSSSKEYVDNLASVASKTKVASLFPSGLKKERGQPSSLAASLAGARDSGTIPSTATGSATATASSPAKTQQQSAPALTRIMVTGTSALEIGTAGRSRDDLDGGSAAAEVGGSGTRHKTSGGAAGGTARTGGAGADDVGALYPGQDAMRRMIVHINTLDPYPCVLGVPVKPALFATSKVYVFACFAVISVMLMYDVVRDMV